MSVFSALFESSKVYNFEQAFGAKDLTSAEMKKAIRDWYSLYYSREATEKEDPCQRLPVAIVAKLYKTVFAEYTAAADNGYADQILAGLAAVRKKAVQHALIGGQCYLKPIFNGSGVHFGVIDRRNYMVLARDDLDNITSIGIAERTEEGKSYYTMLERRTVDSNGYLTIESKLYRSDSADVLGALVPLDTLDKYAMLEPVITYSVPVGSLGLIPVRTPLENCVDGSADSVSVYAPAAGLIHRINVNEAQLSGEFERGESRIIVGSDMMTIDADGKRRRLRDHVFTALDEDPDDIGITIFSPELREQSFLARKNEYLRNIETVIGLKRGILSEVEAAERTATEVTSSAGEYNLTIIDFQAMWEDAVRESARVCSVLGMLYKVTGAAKLDPEKDVTVSWGNGILYDEEKVWTEYKGMVASGMLKPEIALAWYFDMPCDTPEDLQAIREKYMPQLEQLTAEE